MESTEESQTLGDPATQILCTSLCNLCTNMDFCIWKLKIVLVFKKAVEGGGGRRPDGKQQKDTFPLLMVR